MRMIFEPTVDGVDYLELIVTEEEAELLVQKGIVEEFTSETSAKLPLNVFIRLECAIEREKRLDDLADESEPPWVITGFTE